MKDPAFLFYPNDFLSGTYTMEDEQIGRYIKLLCLQHQKGHLTEKDMLKVCKTHDEDVFNKFAKDNNGLFFNKRLEEESIKRKAYSESRRKNREGKTKEKTSLTYVNHMENENINKDTYRSFKHLSVSKEENSKLVGMGYTQRQVDSIYDAIENYAKNKNYTSLYLTARKWLSKEPKERGNSEDTQKLLESMRKK